MTRTSSANRVTESQCQYSYGYAFCRCCLQDINDKHTEDCIFHSSHWGPVAVLNHLWDEAILRACGFSIPTYGRGPVEKANDEMAALNRYQRAEIKTAKLRAGHVEPQPRPNEIVRCQCTTYVDGDFCLGCARRLGKTHTEWCTFYSKLKETIAKRDPQLHPRGPQALSDDYEARKALPLVTGCLDYFPDALIAVAECSRIANEQHNPGEPLHWAREKSTDEVNTLGRHLLQRGSRDMDGIRHSAKVAWRALALLQKEIEEEVANRVPPVDPNAKPL